MKKEVYVVYKSHGEWEGSSIYAICRTKKAATQAKARMVKKGLGYSREFSIEKVLVDMLYPYSILAGGAEPIS